MRTPALLIIIFSVNFLFSQIRTTPLESKGEIPSFLKEYRHESYLIPDITSWQYLKQLKKEAVLDLIYSSNMILFGDPISDYCTNLFYKISGQNNQVYVVRSNYIGTFSNVEGNIFVTTGLISHLSYESQLAFFLLLEADLQQSVVLKATKNVGVLTLDKLIELAGNYSTESISQSEKKIISRLLDLGYSEYELSSFYDIFLYKEAPFYEKQYDWNYFNNEHIQIPRTEYTSVVNPKPTLYNPEKIYPDIVNRRNNLFEQKISKPDNFQPKTLLETSLFNEIIRLGRLESVNIRIMKAEFVMALYEIYILESFGNTSDYLNKMKVLSWWGIVKDKSFEIKKVDFTEYEVSDNEGAYFARYIKRQKNSALLSLAFRHVYDEIQKNQESALYNNILEDLVRLSGKITDFSIEKFYPYTYQYLLDSLDNVQKSDVVNEFTDKQEQLKRSNLTDSIKNYHLYILSDFISDEKIQYLFKDSTLFSKHTYSNEIVEYNTFAINPYKKGRTINLKKKNVISFDRLNKGIEQYNIKLNFPNQSFSVVDYQQKYEINYTFFQNYYHTRFESSILPVKSEEIAQRSITNDNLIGFGFYNHAYRPQLRGFHLLGLLGVTLPYILPELFYRGNKTQTIVFIFDPKTGRMINSSNRKYNDSYSQLTIQNDIINTTLNTLNQ